MIRWRGTHVFDQIYLVDSKNLKFGSSQDCAIYWDGTNNRLTVSIPTISGTDPGRQLYASFTATGAVAAGKQLTGIQLSAIFNGSGNNASVTAAEYKAKHTTGNTATVVQLRGIVGNVDTKNATTTTAYAVEGSVDVSAGGTITTSACFHGNLNNSGTVTTSYGIFVEGVSGYNLTYGMYIKYATTGIIMDDAGTTRAIDIQITPTSADRQLYMDIDYGSNAKEAAYIISSSAKTSGETTALRARGQAKAAGASTAEVRGVHAQGIAFASLYAGTVNAIYAEAIAKNASTVTTIRGAMIACDSEDTPTSITNMYGAHVRVKTSVAPGTAYIAALIETEKFGSGVVLDAFISLKSTTWGAAEECAITGIDFTGVAAKFSHSHIRFPLVTPDGDSSTEGDFWYDATSHVFKYRDNSGAKTITAS